MISSTQYKSHNLNIRNDPKAYKISADFVGILYELNVYGYLLFHLLFYHANGLNVNMPLISIDIDK